jgi:hypothetical protein
VLVMMQSGSNGHVSAVLFPIGRMAPSEQTSWIGTIGR